MCKFYASFIKMLTRAYYEAFVTVVERKGAMATTTEMVPWQHSDDPTTHQDVGANEGVDVWNTQEIGNDPGYRVSHMTVAWKKGNVQRPLPDTMQTRASHTTCIRSRAASRGYTFEACVIGGVRV